MSKEIRKEMIRILVTDGKDGMFYISGSFPDVAAWVGPEADLQESVDVIFGGLTEAAKKAFSFAFINKGQWCSQYGISNEDSVTEFMREDGEVSTRDVTDEFKDFEN